MLSLKSFQLGKGQFAMMHESWPVIRPDDRGEVWMSSWDYPLIVYERVGEGAREGQRYVRLARRR